MAPHPQQQRPMKQRRVSLPASAGMQSISARLDPRLNGSAATTSSSHNNNNNSPGTLRTSEKNHHQFISSPSSTITNTRSNGIPSAPARCSPPSTTTSSSSTMSNGHHHARRASASYGAAPQLPPTATAGDQPLAGPGGSSRRRRAATVSTNKPGAKANANGGDFLIPPNPPSSLMIPSASSSAHGGLSHSTSSASSSLSPAPPEPSTPQDEASTSNAGPGGGPPTKVRKPRKRWTMEETQALVDGCNKWGVGNWKAILNDSQFQFQGRSPVDLKDRFRTYFPDAYRFHYPNAKTHLSSRVRSFLPDGTSIFEKTRSKKRRPFSAEEDEALRLGYEKHGTTWATIVKDPIFQSQERRSTDLRDRFRNAFPELYKAAGYKPRPRASTSAASRAAAAASLAGTSGAATPSSSTKASTSAGPQIQPHHSSASTTSLNTSAASEDWQSLGSSHNGGAFGNANGNGGIPNSSAWMSNPASPTPSDFFIPQPPASGSGSSAQMGRIGKSAWGPSDWLSNNPRLDQGMGLMGGNGALTAWPTPLSDQYAVLDRYDLYSTVEAAHDFASEADVRHNHHSHHHHNHPSHTHSYPDESIFRGFTHHRYAGDLIPGSGVAVHPPSLHHMVLGGFGGGGPAGQLLSFAGSGTALGLGLGGGLQDDYAASVTSGSHVSLAALGLQDIDELSVVNHTSAAPSGAASPLKRSGKDQLELALDLEAMIVVDAEIPAGDHHMQDSTLSNASVGGGPQVHHHQLNVPSAASSSQQSQQSMEEAGAITPTGLNPASLPCPPSPLRLDQARLSNDSSHFRRPFPPPARPHSRSVSTQGQTPTMSAGSNLYGRPTTPSAWARDSSRSISQPPSEHRQALQRSLSYLDPMISTGHMGPFAAGIGGGGLPQVLDDPLAYNEPLSISSLDLQYGMSSGPNIFTPLTMFSDPPSIAPLRTLNSTRGGSNAAAAAGGGSGQQQAGSNSTGATANRSVNIQ
ncbi:hypothetical protein FRB90_004521, partial [Tulasnella sp. 427]